MKSIRVSIDFDVEYDDTEPGAFAYAMAVVDELLSLEIDGDGVKIVQTRSIGMSDNSLRAQIERAWDRECPVLDQTLSVEEIRHLAEVAAAACGRAIETAALLAAPTS